MKYTKLFMSFILTTRSLLPLKIYLTIMLMKLIHGFKVNATQMENFHGMQIKPKAII